MMSNSLIQLTKSEFIHKDFKNLMYFIIYFKLYVLTLHVVIKNNIYNSVKKISSILWRWLFFTADSKLVTFSEWWHRQTNRQIFHNVSGLRAISFVSLWVNYFVFVNFYTIIIYGKSNSYIVLQFAPVYC